jgi:hypothetical protein
MTMPNSDPTSSLHRPGQRQDGELSPARTETGPNPRGLAWAAVGRCIVTSLGMIGRGEIRLAHGNLGRQIHFADGTSARVYRETVVPGRTPKEPCFLAVSFRLRYVRGRGHQLFRLESILNTPLFVGFPGFVSKLWLANDRAGVYRGLYEWDGAQAAETYARSLWHVLALVSEPESIDYRILPELRRVDVVDHPESLAEHVPPASEPEWWRVTAAP